MRVDVVNGFLGAGKTTVIRHLLAELGSGKRVAVLVNELGEVGIDGSLVARKGTGVVELTNGCICCSLTPELRKQVMQIKSTYNPDLLLVEPTGAATVGNVMQVLQAPGMEKYIEQTRVILVVDAPRFLANYRDNRLFVENQIRAAELVLINKCDKVDSETALLVKEAVATCNPHARVLLTRFGRIKVGDWEESPANSAFPLSPTRRQVMVEHMEEEYDSFSWVFKRVVKEEELLCFLEELGETERYGLIVRAKGLVACEKRWLKFDYIPRELFWEPIEPPYGGSRMVVIGRGLWRDRLNERLSVL